MFRIESKTNNLYKTINLLRKFSVPLILGVITALVWANTAPQSYNIFIKSDLIMGHNLYFFVNDVFMAFFFGLAGAELVQGFMPGGPLNPVRKAINPLIASLGGVIGPIIFYLIFNSLFGTPDLLKGWGIPTATDIALAWLAARLIFGAAHSAVKFLLMLTIADDIIGLVIIAVFYPEPLHPVQPIYLLLIPVAMGTAFILRKIGVQNYWVYLLTAGLLSWIGLYHAYLHPSLALFFIVPFLPHPNNYKKPLFKRISRSTLERFKYQWDIIVDFGLFMFGLTNAGINFYLFHTVTWLVLFSLLVGKTIGISLFASIADIVGFPLPSGMKKKDLIMAGLIAAMGLTVALLISGAAFTDTYLQSAAKMGALLSVSAAPIAFILSRVIGIRAR